MKSKILQKIENLFFENAFAELSMDEIAANLGMKKASLYYHFPSKEMMFIEVLNYSYEKYKIFLTKIFKEEDLSKMLKSMITFPFENKNLYSIVLQRGYCKIDSIKEFISTKVSDNQKIFSTGIGDRYGISHETLLIFGCVIDDLSKKYCILGCPSNIDFENITEEIIRLFFKK
ncbi:MAG: TetR/AcrR family transcriptional regulator [Candidatus Gracilibacteria bacterium]|nr:TetR/AcrR family transcriptional regulator [Candidatus Gracilibacteria bacterium]